MEYKINPKVHATIEMITPQKADEFLKTNDGNRKINLANLEKIIYAIKNGEWKLNGEPICFDSNGRLNNGQHRMMAVKKTGISVPFVIVWNVDEDCFATYDCGRKRVAADVFSIAGINQAVSKAAIVKKCMILRNTSKSIFGGSSAINSRMSQLTNDSMLDEYNQNKDLYDLANSMAKRDNRVAWKIIAPSELGGMFAHLVLNLNHPIEKVSDFIEQLYAEKETTCKCIGQLRNILANNLSNQKKLTTLSKSQSIIRTWNNYIKARKYRPIIYQNGDDAEVFM